MLIVSRVFERDKPGAMVSRIAKSQTTTMSGYVERVLTLLGRASYCGLIFCLVCMITRRANLAANEQKVLLQVV